MVMGSIIIPMIGIAALGYFSGCDPVKSGQITKYDQMMPFLATELFKNSPGMTGLYIAAAFSATLSTLSTGFNSFATVFFKSIYLKKMEDEEMIKYQRLFIFIFGNFVGIISYSLKFLPDTVVAIAFLISGVISSNKCLILKTKNKL